MVKSKERSFDERRYRIVEEACFGRLSNRFGRLSNRFGRLSNRFGGLRDQLSNLSGP